MFCIKSKYHLLLFLLWIYSIPCLRAQEPCGTENSFREASKIHPGLLLKRQELERSTVNFIIAKLNSREAGAEPLRIVPVVFHIIHEGGAENISKAQVEDQIRILNLDYRRKNPDTSATPIPFKRIGTDCNIEFRLAKKDPNGNCTDGITRVFSHFTNNVPPGPGDTVVKYLAGWDNTRYLNIWVVKSIGSALSGRSILGIAQFPNGGPIVRDGVLIVSDCIGSIGTAINNSSQGRVATHEIGHWLNLHHIWGDAMCGDDFVEDTPAQQTYNSNCPNFPHVTCGGSNGDMFSNYMDYTNGTCQNIFTHGQKLRMNAAIANARTIIVSADNLIFTGVSDTIQNSECRPKAAFFVNAKTICEGGSLTFFDRSYNADVSKFYWVFEGGTPAYSDAASPSVQYNKPGLFAVKFYIENSSGKDSLIKRNYISVSPLNALFKNFYSESFESSVYPNLDWLLVNDGIQSPWMKTSNAAYSGNACMMVANFSGMFPSGQEVELIGPVLDLTQNTAPKLSYRLAYGQRDPRFMDRLNVFFSTDCGLSWRMISSKGGNELSVHSGGLQYNYFLPAKDEWKLEQLDLHISSLKRASVRIKFQFISGGGNNIYLDDIMVGDLVLGLEKIKDIDMSWALMPNPASGLSNVKFSCKDAMPFHLHIFDARGRLVAPISTQILAPGDYEFQLGMGLEPGIYFVKLQLGQRVGVKKLVLY